MCGFSYINTLYINFKFLPIKQALKLPIILKNTRLRIAKDSIISINSDVCYRGMIQIGNDFLNNYWNSAPAILDVRGGGKIMFGKNVKLGPGSFVRVGNNALLELASNVHSSSGINLYSYYKVCIDEGTKIGWNSIIMDTDSHPLYDGIRNKLTKIYAPIKIGKNCWIGTNVIILKGTTFADNITVRAGSVVSGIYDSPKTVIGGNPTVLIDKNMYITEESFYLYPKIKKKAF